LQYDGFAALEFDGAADKSDESMKTPHIQNAVNTLQKQG
jgi:hypothetical protein